MIRAARAGEEAQVAALINALNSLDAPPPARPMTADIVLRDLLCAEPKALLHVAEQEGTLVGFATTGFVYDAQRQADALMLLDLYVEPGTRRRGLARGLMAALAGDAKRHGAGCLWWGVDEGDDEALLFCRSIGARSEGLFSGEIVEGVELDRLADME